MKHFNILLIIWKSWIKGVLTPSGLSYGFAPPIYHHTAFLKSMSPSSKGVKYRTRNLLVLWWILVQKLTQLAQLFQHDWLTITNKKFTYTTPFLYISMIINYKLVYSLQIINLVLQFVGVFRRWGWRQRDRWRGTERRRRRGRKRRKWSNRSWGRRDKIKVWSGYTADRWW